MITNEQKYRYACYLYYRGTGDDEQSPLSDVEFDELQKTLGHDKTEAFALAYDLTEEEVKAALEWANDN